VSTLTPSFRPPLRQRGVTLIEFMVAVVIGMLMVAALATLIANQSTSRAEVDRTGKMLENGRYALSTIGRDAEMAGYWGEYAEIAAIPPLLPDPCAVTAAALHDAIGIPVQGYDASSAEPACVKHRKPGTDVLVIRRLEPDMSAVLTAGNVDLSKLTAGQIYVQTGLNALGTLVVPITGQAADAATNATVFTAKKKDKVTVANTRKYLVHIYYISACSVPVDDSCAGADGAAPIPTLKRVELSVEAGAPKMVTTTIAEGIEDLQVDFGTDTDADGVANLDSNGAAYVKEDWANVMSLKVYVLARATEPTPGFTDDKTYTLGTKGAASASVDVRGYKRHMFVQSVRLVNPAGRLKT
jgi:type IV pilus assembly protein PilW